VVRTDTLVGLDFGFGEESLIAGAVPAFIVGFIDVIFESFPDQLRPLLVALVSGANKTVVADVQQLSQFDKMFAEFIGKLGGRLIIFSRFFGNFAAVFIRAGRKDNFVTALPGGPTRR